MSKAVDCPLATLASATQVTVFDQNRRLFVNSGNNQLPQRRDPTDEARELKLVTQR